MCWALAVTLVLNLFNQHIFLSVKKHEIKCLLQVFYKLCENQEDKELERHRFRDVIHNEFHMTDDILLDRSKLSGGVCLKNDTKLCFICHEKESFSHLL